MTDPLNAHTLTLKFRRFLSEDEWRLVARAVEAFVPFVQGMDANAVTEGATMMVMTTCEACVFWKLLSKQVGQCHRYPPVVVERADKAVTVWPRTEPTDGCGEGRKTA